MFFGILVRGVQDRMIEKRVIHCNSAHSKQRTGRTGSRCEHPIFSAVYKIWLVSGKGRDEMGSWRPSSWVRNTGPHPCFEEENRRHLLFLKKSMEARGLGSRLTLRTFHIAQGLEKPH
jgi:hypothetical protein